MLTVGLDREDGDAEALPVDAALWTKAVNLVVAELGRRQ